MDGTVYGLEAGYMKPVKHLSEKKGLRAEAGKPLILLLILVPTAGFELAT
jgi:hypothetical protein